VVHGAAVLRLGRRHTGLIEGRVPEILVNITQVVIGCSLGAQFRREFVSRLLSTALTFAPAGTVEMTLTGKVLGLDAALISGFHIVRVIMVMALVVPVFRLFDQRMDHFGVA
jgi:uncharacterized membrane protein AbrB (regulator of aidB expression)